MAVYQFSVIAGGSVPFDPANDVLQFSAGTSASEVRIEQSGADIVVTLGAASARLTGVLVAQLIPGDFLFADGSLILVGDLTLGTADDVLGNLIHGTSAADYMLGLPGDDRLIGGLGADVMVGGTGNDTYYVDSAADVVVELEDEGTDKVLASIGYTLGANVDNLTLQGALNLDGTGNALANAIRGNAGDNALFGEAGNDSLSGGAGDDVMTGGTGNDTYYVDSTADAVVELENEGTDLVRAQVDYTLSANVEKLTLTGPLDLSGTGNDLANVITGNTGDDELFGEAGDDALVGGLGDDTMTGGTGNDTYYVDSTADVVVELADEGTDLVWAQADFTLSANVENLTLTGTLDLVGTGNDLANVIVGNAGDNQLFGEAGDDRLNGRAGDDVMTGGTGNDTYYVDSTADVVVELADEGTDKVLASIDYTLGANVENLTLTGTLDLIGTGNALANAIRGNAGDNELFGEAGNDRLSGGAGDDVMTGGTGNDTYYVDSTADVVVEAADSGIDRVKSSISYILGNHLEDLKLNGTGDINGSGNGLDNVIVGNSGNNWLLGGGGVDFIDGGAGDDLLVLNGIPGCGCSNSVLIGGQGRDVLSGGVDIVAYTWEVGDTDQNGTTAATTDHITDWFSGGNVIDVSAIAATLPDGFFELSEIGPQAYSVWATPSDCGCDSLLSFDITGDDLSDFTIYVTNLPAEFVSEFDFLGVGAPPDALDALAFTGEGRSVSGQLSAAPDPDTYSYAVETGPANGTIDITPSGAFTYTPSGTFNGPDSFTWSVESFSGEVDIATVTVDVEEAGAPVIATGETSDDTFRGTDGADRFTALLDNGNDRLADFAVGEDQIDLAAFILGDFATLEALFSEVDADGDGATDDARIDLSTVGGGRIDIIDLVHTTLTANEFLL